MEKLTWARRAKVIRSEVSTRKVWPSEGGRYVLEFVQYTHPDLSPLWRVLIRCGEGTVVMFRNRTRNAAEKAVNKHRRART